MRHKAPHKAPRPIGREHVDVPLHPSLHEVKLNVPASLIWIMFEMPAFQLAFYRKCFRLRSRPSLLADAEATSDSLPALQIIQELDDTTGRFNTVLTGLAEVCWMIDVLQVEGWQYQFMYLNLRSLTWCSCCRT